MKIVFLRFMDGINIRGNRKIIDCLLKNISNEDVEKIFLKYEVISKTLDIGGKGLSFEYVKEGARMFFSYEVKFVSKYILESLIYKKEEQLITIEAKEILEESFEREVESKCLEKDLPFYSYKENEIQIGYGANNFIVTKDDKILDDRLITNNSRIPIISITGTNGKTTTAKLIYNTLMLLGYKTGMSSTGGIYINSVKVLSGDTTGYFSAKEVLSNKDVDVAVLESARGGIVKQGLAYSLADVAIITSLSDDHVGMEGAKTIDELGAIKSLVMNEVAKEGIVIAKAQYDIIKHINLDKKVIVFDFDKTDYMKELINNGYEAYYVDDNCIVRESDNIKEKLICLDELEFSFYGASKSNVKNIICAIVAVERIHNNLDEILNAIKTLKCDYETNRGRQNLIEKNGIKYIIDYGHNEEAFLEVYDLAEAIKGNGKIISIINAPGDRTNAQIIKLGKISAKNSDFVIVKEMHNPRGRVSGEVASLLLYGINAVKFKKDNTILILNGDEAFDYSLNIAKKNDVVIYFVQDKSSINYALNKLKAQGF